MTTCGRCGLLNRADLRFCADCGARLEAQAPAPPPAASPGPQRGAQTGCEPWPGVTRAAATPGPRVRFRAADAGRALCPHCGTPNDPNGRFCTACGQGLNGGPPAPPRELPRKDVVTCSRCHGSNVAGQPYCQFCGARLTPEQEPQPAAPPAEGPPRDASAGEPPARLVVIAQDGTPGTEYPIIGAQAEIGRDDGAIRLPTDPYVSPRHLLISRRNGRFFVRDLESVNGVYVRLRAAEVLRHADLVLIGLEVLRFELVSDAERGLGPATERGTRVFGSPSAPRHARLCQLTVEGVSVMCTTFRVTKPSSDASPATSYSRTTPS
jgi:hypothetical protein